MYRTPCTVLWLAYSSTSAHDDFATVAEPPDAYVAVRLPRAPSAVTDDHIVVPVVRTRRESQRSSRRVIVDATGKTHPKRDNHARVLNVLLLLPCRRCRPVSDEKNSRVSLHGSLFIISLCPPQAMIPFGSLRRRHDYTLFHRPRALFARGDGPLEHALCLHTITVFARRRRVHPPTLVFCPRGVHRHCTRAHDNDTCARRPTV